MAFQTCGNLEASHKHLAVLVETLNSHRVGEVRSGRGGRTNKAQVVLCCIVSVSLLHAENKMKRCKRWNNFIAFSVKTKITLVCAEGD